jgi:hypothetical protein
MTPKNVRRSEVALIDTTAEETLSATVAISGSEPTSIRPTAGATLDPVPPDSVEESCEVETVSI